ncbi:MAG: hypothetical protein AAF197_02980 [Pseudomonadota bacterium]
MTEQAGLGSEIGILLFRSPSKRGVISTLADFFERYGFEIVSFQEFLIAGDFVARVTWRQPESRIDVTFIRQQLAAVQVEFEAQIDAYVSSKPQSIGLLASGHKKLVSDMLAKCESGELTQGSISFVLSQDESMGPIVNRFGVPFFLVGQDSAIETERKAQEIVRRYRPSIVGVANFGQELSAKYVSECDSAIFSVQTGFLPVAEGVAKVEHSNQWAARAGARLMVSSTYFLTGEVNQNTIIDQNARDLPVAVTLAEIESIRDEAESSLFVSTMELLLRHKVLQQDKRCVVFQ